MEYLKTAEPAFYPHGCTFCGQQNRPHYIDTATEFQNAAGHLERRYVCSSCVRDLAIADGGWVEGAALEEVNETVQKLLDRTNELEVELGRVLALREQRLADDKQQLQEVVGRELAKVIDLAAARSKRQRTRGHRHRAGTAPGLDGNASTGDKELG